VAASSVAASPCATPGLAARSCMATPMLDTLSIAGSVAPSILQSPFIDYMATASARATPTPPAAQPPLAESMVSVRVLNGVSGEEENRFTVPAWEAVNGTPAQFLNVVDQACRTHGGQALSSLSWLSQVESGGRFERRPCDERAVEELFGQDGGQRRGGAVVLLLCTVPQRPPSELPTAPKVRLRSVTPVRVSLGSVAPVRLRLETSAALEATSHYSVAFTHQWTNATHYEEAKLLPSTRGVELVVPPQMLAVSTTQSTDGLYDVHLVIDRASRSENRRTLTVGSAESEVSSSTSRSTTFVPIPREAVNA